MKEELKSMSWSEDMVKKLTANFSQKINHTSINQLNVQGFIAGIDPVYINDPGFYTPDTYTVLPFTTTTPSTTVLNWSNIFTNFLPENAIPVKQTIFPYKEQTVFITEGEPGKYYFKKNTGYDKDLKKTQITEHVESIQIVDSVRENNTLDGVQPAQVIIALADHLTKKQDKTTEESEALKHLKYSLAYLEKDIMNKAKEAALETT